VQQQGHWSDLRLSGWLPSHLGLVLIVVLPFFLAYLVPPELDGVRFEDI
jgi:hypothetical protein